MLKKKFFVMIVLIIACVILIFTLFILSSVPAVGNVGSGAGISIGAGGADDDENLPNPVVFEWELPIVVSITGAESATGLAAAWGFDYGIKAVNEMGGIRGLPVGITVRDTASSIAEVTTEIEMLTPDSLVIMGPPTETDFKAGVQTFFNAGLPTIGAATDAKNRNVFKPFTISCITDPGITSESIAATWVRIERFTKVCIIYAPLSSEHVDNIGAALILANKSIEEIEIGNEVFDAATIAEKALSTGADAFYIDMTGEDSFRIVTQLKFLAGENAGNLIILCGPLAADKELIDSLEGSDIYGVRVWATIDPDKDVEKRKAFYEAFDKNVGDLAYRGLAIDYYQSAHMLKQAIETLGLTGEPETIKDERALLADWLFNSELIHTEHGDFFVVDGGKAIETKLYRITEKGLQ